MKIEKLIISNNTNQNVEYSNLVNSIANIQDYTEVYICLDKFQCITIHDNIRIKLDDVLSSHENVGTFINNSRIIDTSLFKRIIEDAVQNEYIHDLENSSEHWIKINSIGNLNNLKFSFETMGFMIMTTTKINDLQFTLHLRIKLI